MLAHWLLIKTIQWFLSRQCSVLEFFKILPRSERREMWGNPGAASSQDWNRSVFNYFPLCKFPTFTSEIALIGHNSVGCGLGWSLPQHNKYHHSLSVCLCQLETDFSLLVFWTRPVTNKPFGPIVTLSQGSICPGKMRVSLWGFHRN